MTEHEKILLKLNEYVDGECSKEDAVLIEKHISTCDECQKELEILKKITSIFDECMDDAPCELHRRVMSSVESTKQQKNRHSFYKRLSLISAAAVIALAVFASPFISMQLNGGAQGKEYENAASGNDAIFDKADGDLNMSPEEDASADGNYSGTSGESSDKCNYVTMLDGSKKEIVFGSNSTIAIIDGVKYSVNIIEDKEIYELYNMDTKNVIYLTFSPQSKCFTEVNGQ